MVTFAHVRIHLAAGVLIIVMLVLASFTDVSVPVAYGATSLTASLVQIIDTSNWQGPPSPDPSGITYWAKRNTLMVVDGEVEEMPNLFQGANAFEATLAGKFVQAHSTMKFSKEPVGIDIEVDPQTGYFFISDDNQKQVFVINLVDDILGNADDQVTSFSTSAFGNNDPEGLSFGKINGQRKLFIVDGGGAEVYVVDPGADGIFNGVAPEGDDQVTHFDVGVLGMRDPEGIDYDPAIDRLYVIDRSRDRLHRMTTSGTDDGILDLRTFIPDVLNPADVTLAPGSTNSAVMNLYIPDRGVDNNTDPNENDGKIYEIALGTSPSPSPAPSGNLLTNASFEDDANNDGKPDVWSTNKKFIRSSEIPAADGTYVGRFSATDNSGANSYQTVAASAGTTYTFACSASIPPQNDSTSFSLKFQVRWLNSSNSTISTWTVKTLTAPTSDWVGAMGSKAAPSGTVNAQIRLVVSSLNGTIYVDHCAFGS